MQISQIKNDIKISLETEQYYAENEFYRLLDDSSIPHVQRINLLKEQLTVLTNSLNGIKLLEGLLPERPNNDGEQLNTDEQQ